MMNHFVMNHFVFLLHPPTQYKEGLKGGLDALKTTPVSCGSAGGSNSTCTKHQDCGKTG
jgi:hypothetical protein